MKKFTCLKTREQKLSWDEVTSILKKIAKEADRKTEVKVIFHPKNNCQNGEAEYDIFSEKRAS